MKKIFFVVRSQKNNTDERKNTQIYFYFLFYVQLIRWIERKYFISLHIDEREQLNEKDTHESFFDAMSIPVKKYFYAGVRNRGEHLHRTGE